MDMWKSFASLILKPCEFIHIANDHTIYAFGDAFCLTLQVLKDKIRD